MGSAPRWCSCWSRQPGRRYTAGVATITIHPGGERVPVTPARSLLNTLLAEGIRIDTVCGGRAECGRCLVRVRAGAGALSLPTARETARLAALGAGPDHRLGCQTFARADVEIEIVNPRPAPPAPRPLPRPAP